MVVGLPLTLRMRHFLCMIPSVCGGKSAFDSVAEDEAFDR